MKYKNPIIKGFNPDPSICRVGEDYYLATSSFEYFPGIPVYHSRDLVNWEHIGNAIDRAEQLPLETAKSSGGIWAPTIRYNDGKFYITATLDGKGNFIIVSDNPASGYSNAVWTEFSGIDPSIFFEDGKMYYMANDCGERNAKFGCEGVSLAEMNPETGEVIGEIKRVWSGNGGGWLEAPHIYHIGEYYYILAAEGGTSAGHHAILGRSKSIWGEYENCPKNPILTNRNDCSKQITYSGHGDLVDDKNGNWWMVHLGVRPFENTAHLGRETFLMPVIWNDGWFSVGEKGMSMIEVDAPLWDEQRTVDSYKANFSVGIEKEWLFRRMPHTENYRIENGRLIIKPSRVKLSDSTDSPSFMAVRPIDLSFETEASLEINTENNGDVGGMVVYLDERFYYRIYKKRENNKDYIVFEKQVDDINVIEFKEEITSQRIRMKIKSDGRKYYFYYAENSGEYISVGSGSVKFLAPEIAGKCFTGNLVGIFAECDEETTSSLIVEEFCMTMR